MKTFCVQINPTTGKFYRANQQCSYMINHLHIKGYPQYIVRAENINAAIAEAEGLHCFFTGAL